MGYVVPGSKSVCAYVGYVPVSGNSQRFMAKLNSIRQDMDPRDYDLSDGYDWFNFFAQFYFTQHQESARSYMIFASYHPLQSLSKGTPLLWASKTLSLKVRK